MATIRFATGTRKSDGAPRFLVYSPFHPDMPAAARALGGKWNAGTGDKPGFWAFDARDESGVRDLVRTLYGYDEYERPDLVQLVIRLTGSYDDGIWIAGRQVARRVARDYAVWLGDGVVLLEGKFSSSGGSRANPRIGSSDGTVLLMRDVPRLLAHQERDSGGWGADLQIFEPDATPEQIRGVLAAQQLTGGAPVSFERNA